MAATARHDVAIYAPFASPLLLDPPAAPPGGAEVQVTLLARTLAAGGLRVCQIVYPLDGVPRERDGVRIVQRPRSFVGDPGGPLREAAAHWRGLHHADARVYVHRSAGPEVALTAGYCRAAGRRFVYSSSSTDDFSPGRFAHSRRDRMLFDAGLRLADAIALQSEEQVALAHAKVPGIETAVIRSLRPLGTPADGERGAFLWAGRSSTQKNPLAYVELARAVPEARFVIVAQPSSDPALAVPIQQLETAARELPNLEFRGPLPQDELFRLIAGAAAVVNTSPSEGMPNTFLEGWAAGVPALSLNVDIDGLIESHGLGVAAGGSWEAFVAGARKLWAIRAEINERAIAYVRETHAPDAVAGRWLSVLGLS